MLQTHRRIGCDVDENPFQHADLLNSKIDSSFVRSAVSSIANPHLDLITGEASCLGEFFNTLSLLQRGHGEGKEEQL